MLEKVFRFIKKKKNKIIIHLRKVIRSSVLLIPITPYPGTSLDMIIPNDEIPVQGCQVILTKIRAHVLKAIGRRLCR